MYFIRTKVSKSICFISAILCLGTFFLLLAPIKVEAETETYYVKPLLPENHQGNEISYYDLLMKPAQSQVIQLEVVNNTSQNRLFTIDIVDSLTTSDGAIGYDKKVDYDPTLKHKFTDTASAVKDVRISAGESQVVDITLTMPKEQFDGLMVGGIHVAEVKETSEAGGIDNVFSYIVPVKIHETAKFFPSQLKFHGTKVEKNEQGYQVIVEIQNANPNLLTGLTLQTTIHKKEYQDTLYEHTMKNVQIAPNSNFSPLISLAANEIEAGDYEIEFYATNENFSEKWTSEFTISKKKSANFNAGFVIHKETLNWRTVALGLLMVGGVLILVLTMLRRKPQLFLTVKSKKTKKQNSQINSSKENQKKKKYLLFWLFICWSMYHPTVLADEKGAIEIGSSHVSVTITKTDDATESSAIQGPDRMQPNAIQENPTGIVNHYLPRTNETNYQSLSISNLDIYITIGSLIVLVTNKKRKKEEK